MTQLTKSQHYVGRASLRQLTANFLDEQQRDLNAEHFRWQDGTLYARQRDGKVFQSSVINVAQENYFYELKDPKKEALAGGPNAVEKRLATLEGGWASALRTVLTETIQPGVARNSRRRPVQKILYKQRAAAKQELACLAAFQVIRTSSFREYLKRELAKTQPAITPVNPDALVREGTAELILVGDQLSNYAQLLESGIWVLGINDGQEPLYTSDHPLVAWVDSPQDLVQGGVSFFPKSAVMLLPLSYKVILQIYERSYWSARKHALSGKTYRDLDGFSYQMSNDEVADYNAYQRVLTEPFLFSPTPAFAHASHQAPRRPFSIIV